ncbi:hypothetical protein QQP08_006489 [Theobroma cacao]|nr:hypothetical protein QQP08_006489 [Theobroma cacao]
MWQTKLQEQVDFCKHRHFWISGLAFTKQHLSLQSFSSKGWDKGLGWKRLGLSPSVEYGLEHVSCLHQDKNIFASSVDFSKVRRTRLLFFLKVVLEKRYPKRYHNPP